MPAVIRVDPRRSESAEHASEHALVQERLAMAERQVVRVAEGHAMRDIEIAGAVPGSGVSTVRSGAGVAFQLLWTVIQTARVSIGRTQVKTVAEAAQQARFQPVV